MSELDDVRTTIGVIDGLRTRIAELEADVAGLLSNATKAEVALATLKCCGNCGTIHTYNAGTDDEFRECPYLREDGAEHDYLSIGCHYNPSRWKARAEEGGEDEA